MKGPILGFLTFESFRVYKKGFFSLKTYFLRFMITMGFMLLAKNLIINNAGDYQFEVSFIISGFAFSLLDVFEKMLNQNNISILFRKIIEAKFGVTLEPQKEKVVLDDKKTK